MTRSLKTAHQSHFFGCSSKLSARFPSMSGLLTHCSAILRANAFWVASRDRKVPRIWSLSTITRVSAPLANSLLSSATSWEVCGNCSMWMRVVIWPFHCYLSHLAVNTCELCTCDISRHAATGRLLMSSLHHDWQGCLASHSYRDSFASAFASDPVQVTALLTGTPGRRRFSLERSRVLRC